MSIIPSLTIPDKAELDSAACANTESTARRSRTKTTLMQRYVVELDMAPELKMRKINESKKKLANLCGACHAPET